jgi:molybdopterin converting factor small subunit
VQIVSVQLFASYADIFGGPTVELALPPGGTVRDLLDQLRTLPGARLLPSSPRVAVNRTFVVLDQTLLPNDEIALIPPVAGG